MPDPFGPRDENGQDIFQQNSPEDTYKDCWVLHTGFGELHCGTNAKRAIPSTKWWAPEEQMP